jgi:hypothetical protein
MADQVERVAPNAIATCLNRLLIVPRIYLHARWPGDAGRECDILAIDRDGQGEAHIVEIRRTAKEALARVPALLEPGVKAPFRWVAYLSGTEDADASLALISKEPLNAKGSPGRVGVIQFFEMAGGDAGANVVVKADRFPGGFYDLSRAFSAAHNADQQY